MGYVNVRKAAGAEVIPLHVGAGHRRALARMVEEPWGSKRELAERLGISTRTVDRWVQQGLPEAKWNEPGAWRQVGSRRRFMASAVMQWLDGQAA